MLNSFMREIVLDTESTGFEPGEGHRLVEIGCLELFNHVPTGKTYQIYLNPERDVPAEAVAVHGLTESFLKDKPLFSEVVEDFLAFIGNDQLVIHNAEFDLKFLDAELARIGFKNLRGRPVVDTVLVARKKFPGQPASLDALCRRFGIDNTARTFHGALLDVQLLAEVYLELCGGRQQGLDLMASSHPSAAHEHQQQIERKAREPRVYTLSEDDQAAHDQLVKKLGDGAIWSKST
jgi:DNA polymerase III subunit epsilon